MGRRGDVRRRAATHELIEVNGVQLTPDQTMKIFQRAIDNTAGAGEGEAWWQEVQSELEAVIEAPTKTAAAEVIEWWHGVWSDIGDTPVRAAGHIRT